MSKSYKVQYKWLDSGKTKKLKYSKKKQPRKEGLFLKLINKVLKLKHLKMFEIALGWVKGMSLKIEFFEDKTKKE